jgi:hypothetical protein
MRSRAGGFERPKSFEPCENSVLAGLFETRPTIVTPAAIAGIELRRSLEEIKARHRQYYSDEMG